MTARPFLVFNDELEKQFILLKNYSTHITIIIVHQKLMEFQNYQRKLCHLYVIEILNTVKMTPRPL